jgi:predicted dehydrogenase
VNILQVGLGNFGKRHLEAWHRLGRGEELTIVELDESKWEQTKTFNVPRARLTTSLADVIGAADIVDIVTPTDSHFELCRTALERGKDVFIEKPMTMNSSDARKLVDLAERNRRLIQVGFYYRFHPISQVLKREMESGRFGKIRYVTGDFRGFKRPRMDVGVTHTDGIHFLDLFNWLLGAPPVEVYAVCRDHFGRKLEDFSVVMLTYPDGTVGKVESGYIQPGRWKDKVVPGALTTKEITVVGEKLTAEVDFESETLTLHDAHHEIRNGAWAAVVGGSTTVPVEPCDPVQMVARELASFLDNVASRKTPPAGPVESGLNLAVLMEAIYESARANTPVKVRVA